MKMGKDEQFAKDVRLQVRTTNYRRSRIKKRARDLGLDVSKYILSLIKKDMDSNEEAEL